MQRRAHMALAWLLAIGWGAFIWGLGSDGFSMSSTSRFLGPLIAWLGPDWTAAARETALVAIRKLAHVTEYAVFALLLGRAIALATRLRMRFVVAATLGAAALLAAADESRQAVSSARTGSPLDVGLDVAGALLALAALLALRRWLDRPLFGPARPAPHLSAPSTAGAAPGGPDAASA